MVDKEGKVPDSDSPSGKIMNKKENIAPPEQEILTDDEKVRQIPIHKLDMKRFIELDACTRCGECLSWCPVYDQEDRENRGDLTPRRKILDF